MGDILVFLNFYLVPGIVLGSIYALGAIGVSMVFGILRFAHFAHGDMMTLGAFVALSAVGWLGVGPLLALPFAVIGTIIIYTLIQSERLEREARAKAEPLMSV